MKPQSALLAALALGAICVGLYVRSIAPRPLSGIEVPIDAEPQADRDSPWSAGSRPPSRPGAEREPARAAARAEAQAAKLAADELLTRGQVRSTLEKVLAGKLPDRELTLSNYERLTDAVLEIRAANRVLKGIPESATTSELRAARVEALRSAIAEIQDVTGVPPASLGDLLGDTGDAVEAPPS
jgi:hypothetical protein